jgi:hypothetical protein
MQDAIETLVINQIAIFSTQSAEFAVNSDIPMTL